MSTETSKAEKVEFKDSFLKIVKTIGLFKPEELDRIVTACEGAGSYEGLINQSFGAMAKRLHEQQSAQFQKADIALPILTALLAKPVENAAAVSPDHIEEAYALADKFIAKMNEGLDKK